MPVLVTSKSDEDPIKNEQASLETQFSHYKYGKFFRRSRAPNSVGSGPIWPKFELVRDFMPVLVIIRGKLKCCKFEKNLIKKKQQRKGGDIVFPMSMGIFCCFGNQGFDPICPKTLCNFSPTLTLHIIFDQH